MLVASRALQVADADGGRPALSDAAGRLTYDQLRARVRAGHRPAAAGAAWVLQMPSTSDAVATFVAHAMNGWAVATIDPTWTDAERSAAARQVEPTPVDDVAAGGDAFGVWHQMRQLWQTAQGARGDVTADTDFYIGFTSGSSGVPKAFARTHRSWWESFAGLDLVAPIDSGVVLVPGALSSSHFLFGALYGLHCGAHVELTDWSPADLARRLGEDPHVTAAFVVPSMLGQIADHLNAPTERPVTFYCAGARLERHVRNRVAEHLPHATIVEYYGASELSFVAIRVDGDGTPVGSVGRPFPGVHVTIRDDEGRTLPADTTGLIFVQSPLVFSGYRGTVPESAALHHGDAWSVGDSGSLDDEGYLTVHGRGSSLIIVAGANVQPDEVEQVVAQVAEVDQVVVVGVDDPRLGQRLVACITSKGPLPTRAALRTHVGAHLSRHKHPHRYVLLPGPLPLGRTGKIDRDATRELVLAGKGEDLS